MNTTTWKDLLHPGDANDFFTRRNFLEFDPTTSNYRPANALWLAELSRLVYRHDAEENTPPAQPTQSDILKQHGCTKRQFFISRETDTQAMLVEFGGKAPYAVLAFRGTEQHIKDFVTDLSIGQINHTDGKIAVHEGFKHALDSIWNELEPALKKINVPLFYTGHSLGAALATLAAARRSPTALYTFGSPRVGDADFVASLNGIAFLIHRIVDDQDVVTTLPPEELGFQHAGNERVLVVTSAHNFFSWLAGFFGPPKFLADHAPINYVDRL